MVSLQARVLLDIFHAFDVIDYATNSLLKVIDLELIIGIVFARQHGTIQINFDFFVHVMSRNQFIIFLVLIGVILALSKPLGFFFGKNVITRVLFQLFLLLGHRFVLLIKLLNLHLV